MKEPAKDLKSYIEAEIFPRYTLNDPGHDLSHIENVINRSFHLANFHHLKLNTDYIFTAAAFHDLGCSVDRATHEIISAKMFLADDFIKSFFTPGQRTTISRAIADHRASLGHPPRNIYGKLLSSADRITNIDSSLRRSYELRAKPDQDLDTILEQSFDHFLKKFGRSGYATNTTYFSDGAFEAYLADFQTILADKSTFIARFKKANNLP